MTPDEEPTDVTCDAELNAIDHLQLKLATVTAERDHWRAEADRMNGEKNRAYEYRASRAVEVEQAYREGYATAFALDDVHDADTDWACSQAKKNLEMVK